MDSPIRRSRSITRAAAVALLMLVALLAPSVASAKLIRGTMGGDTLRGTPNADTIRARGGDDMIRAGSGDDVVHPGRGTDVVRGGAGDDQIHADSSDGDADTIICGAGYDTVWLDGEDDAGASCERVRYMSRRVDEVVLPNLSANVDEVLLPTQGCFPDQQDPPAIICEELA